MTTTITVLGVPAGQGNIRYSAQGRGYHANGSKLRPWRANVRAAAGRVFLTPLDGPVLLEMTVTLPRPANHFRTGRHAQLLRDDAPVWPIGSRTGDADHYLRAVSDALTGVAYTDDCLIVEGTVSKVYPAGGVDALDQPGAVIRITPLGGAT